MQTCSDTHAHTQTSQGLLKSLCTWFSPYHFPKTTVLQAGELTCQGDSTEMVALALLLTSVVPPCISSLTTGTIVLDSGLYTGSPSP